MDPVAEGACCEACARYEAPEPPAPPTGPAVAVVQPARPTIGRGADRRITFGGLLVAAVLLGVAGASAIGSGTGSLLWLPVHLAMAGAASTAVAAVLPFFTAALAQVGPARPTIRIAAIALVAGGSILAAVGMTGAGRAVAVVGGMAFLGGLSALAASAFLPLRAAIGSTLSIVRMAYAAALAQVGIGVLLATTMLAGWPPVVEAWTMLKPAHAWLNVFGFLTLVVCASLLHLAPTVSGARIRPRRSIVIALVCLMTGAPLIALGYAVGLDAAGRIGAVAELVGALALAVHAGIVHRDRGRWTSDLGWHRFAALSLLAAPVWLLVAVAIGSCRILWLGVLPEAWSVAPIVVPLVGGGIGQVLVGSFTHLVPAIGPGDQAAHAIQRRWLGRWSTTRWLSGNVGVAVATAGTVFSATPLLAAGGMLVGSALLGTLVLLAVSVSVNSWRSRAATA
jgi:hypothetical protein